MSFAQKFASAATILTLFGAGVASAQTYPLAYPPTYGQTYSAGCVNLVSDLSYGSRGSDVRSLQSFLIAQNYPGGGSWMLTGYFGQATGAALRNFQQSQGLAQTGVTDAQTRAAISRVSCQGYSSSNPYYPTYPTYPTYPNYPTYPYPTQPTYPNTQCGVYPSYYPCTALVLTSLSVNTGGPGTSVTINGSGFDWSGNTVYFGSQSLGTFPSNGSSITFSVPQYSATGNINVYITNSRGTSNALSFNYTGSYGCGMYPYSYGYGYGYNSGSCYPTPYPTPYPTNQLMINYLSPNSGAIGTTVGVNGSGFSAMGNSVRFGNGIIANLPSYDGRSLSFVVPTQLTGFGSQPVVPGVYNVSVSNSSGATTNAVPFTVTGYGPATSAPIINSVNGPSTLQTGFTGTWSITITVPPGSYTTVRAIWGDSSAANTDSSASQAVYGQGQQTVTFTHAYATSGTYTPTFTVSNAAGQNSSSMTVVVSGTSGSPTLSSISPTSGRVGTQVVISGNGFTSDNTVRFGIGGTQHVPSYNGTTIYYTIPSYVSPCDLNTAGQVCATYVQQVVPGTYPVYVTNGSGSTNQVSFIVVQ